MRIIVNTHATHRTPRFLTATGITLCGALVLSACAPSGDVDHHSGAAGDEEETRMVDHAMGTTEVSQSPSRVVVLDTVLLDASVALDVAPVGAALVAGTEALPEYLGDSMDQVEDVGAIEEPSLEAIAELEPDLILSAKTRHENIYEELSRIAPTVFVEAPGGDWQGSVELVGEALDADDRATELLSEYEDRTREVRESLDADDITAHIIRPRDDGQLRLYGPETFTGDVISDLGFEIPEQQWDTDGIVEISSEHAVDVEADHLFISSDPSAPGISESAHDVLESGADHVAEVDHATWIAGVGPLGAEEIISEVEEILDG